MIWFALLYFLIISAVCTLLLSHHWRHVIWQGIKNLIPATQKRIGGFSQHILSRAHRTIEASTDEGRHWYQQQILVLLAGVFLISAPVLWMATREASIPAYEEQAEINDSQIYALLEGEMLVPPPEVDAELIVAAEAIAQQAERIIEANPTLPQAMPVVHATNLRFADRKWEKMNPRYVQRLLLVFKTMKERHGYDMVLLEGYRSPQRQNMLAGKGAHVTKATGYRSYHQFGLAGDVAFMRNGKVVITEKDPWAMRGYQLYGEVAESVGLTWGGRWKMMDLGHTEFRVKGILGRADIAQKMISESGKSIIDLN